MNSLLMHLTTNTSNPNHLPLGSHSLQRNKQTIETRTPTEFDNNTSKHKKITSFCSGGQKRKKDKKRKETVETNDPRGKANHNSKPVVSTSKEEYIKCQCLQHFPSNVCGKWH
jgi:hypothetical protein